MKKILIVVLLSIVSAKLYSSDQELVFKKPLVVGENIGLPGDDGCIYRKGDKKDCSVGSYNGCAALMKTVNATQILFLLVD